MDGNGRWAQRRDLPRTAGHRRGIKTARRIVKAAPDLGIGTLTLFAFASDNWSRPQREVDMLMQLFATHLASEAEHCLREDIRLSIIGRRERLPDALQAAISHAEALTAGCRRLDLRLAIDYSSRDAIIRAAELCEGDPSNLERFAGLLYDGTPITAGKDVDLLIRTGGEQRFSDFLLWECAYAELYFSPIMWPDFNRAALRSALEEFGRRERRFGRVTVRTPSTQVA